MTRMVNGPRNALIGFGMFREQTTSTNHLFCFFPPSSVHFSFSFFFSSLDFQKRMDDQPSVFARMTLEQGPDQESLVHPLIAHLHVALVRDRYNLKHWTVLLNHLVEHREKIDDDIRSLLESFLGVFPTSARYWRYYIEQEMNGGDYKRVESLFQRCLTRVLDADLLVVLSQIC